MRVESECCGCSLCANICPVDAIVATENLQGFLEYNVDEDKCIHCKLCHTLCKSSLNQKNEYVKKGYAGISKDTTLRLNSSSGGIFSEIASKIIADNGVVYGVAYDSDNSVVHIRVDNKNDLRKLQGSKYVQSVLNNIFALVKHDLISEKTVLFSGTPCQIEGLCKFLKKKYEKLYTVDIVCHGVTSRKIWKDYLNYISNNGKKHINDINFRDKKTGWHRFSFSYRKDGKKVSRLFIDDPFCFFFDKHFSINPTCFNCKYASNDHKADITLGDLWGIENFPYVPDDNQGTSLIIVSSDKGEELLTQITNIDLIPIDKEKAMIYNLHEPPKKPTNYDEFWGIYNLEGIKKCIKVYFYGTFMHRCKLLIKCLLTKADLIKFFIKRGA